LILRGWVLTFLEGRTMKKICALIIVLLFVPLTSSAQDFCEGNFDCDQDVDGSDAAIFKEDFGRNVFENPCETCIDSPCPCNPCPYGMVDCGNKCVDSLTDRDYCGADINCLGGTVCRTGEICDGGVCILSCPSGLTKCGGLCVDTDTDEDYCGSCFNNCTSGEMCVLGTCEIVGGVVYKSAVEKTGQTISYAAGDDGDLEEGVNWPTPRFTDNFDGTVKDNMTGLIWMKHANCFGPGTWDQALSDCNGLTDGACGLLDDSNAGDWRLPNKKELISLTHYGYIEPALPNGTGTGQWSPGNPFNHVVANYPNAYWSSTTFAGFSYYVWEVHMDVGNTLIDDKAESNFVWCVRGGH
jgi:hypothetical protein